LPVVPQTQVPFVQLSAVLSQETHTAPPVPHVLSEVERHVLFWQQPFGQLVASHTHAPLTHAWPAAHAAPVPHTQAPLAQVSAVVPQATHAAPETPQLPAVIPGRQVLPLQHPVGQLVALQAQAPLTHARPAAQAAPVVPHTHLPLAQVSAVVPQATQVAPEAPQLPVVLPGRQVLPLQQPVGQLVALQTQAPLTHA
jgi:hypothetical protein